MNVHLTDAEREALLNQMILEYGEDKQTWRELGSFRRLSNVVESIIAARLEQQREAIRVVLVQQANTAWGEHNAAADDGCINAATEHGHAAETWEAAVTLVREYQPREDT